MAMWRKIFFETMNVKVENVTEYVTIECYNAIKDEKWRRWKQKESPRKSTGFRYVS